MVTRTPARMTVAALAHTGPRAILCLGAHADDIEIGCGGTLLRLFEARPGIAVRWHVFSAPGPRRAETRRSARAWLTSAGASTVTVASFRESYFPDQWAAIKGSFDAFRSFEPDLVFTHARDDRHQDHRVISDLTWNTFRDNTVLEYEIPKYDGDLGQPNVYVTLDEATCRRKIDGLRRHFVSQHAKPWFTDDAFWALLRLRGVECGPRARFAEAFHGRKLVV